MQIEDKKFMVNKTYKNLILPFSVVILFSAGFLFYYFSQTPATLAQTAPAAEIGAGDGIAVRVMPNTDHVSPLEWYKKNIKQPGSPSRLLVDGYEALQEGRTVYVNVGNADNLTCSNNTGSCVGKKADEACASASGTCQFTKLYTNIHIISYTQDAGSDTKEIFNQLLNNWTFNTNIIADSKADFCLQISDNKPDPAGKKCYTDAQCGKNSGLYCNSLKARVTRDVRRLADLKEITTALDGYQAKNKDYPTLAAGSYLANKSVSVWPSWQQTLGKELGKTLPVDPINKLIGCSGGYDAVTCWNEKDKKFNGTVPNGLPQGSHAYVYEYSVSTNADNTKTIKGRICALMESVVAKAMVGSQACVGSNFNPVANTIISGLTIESVANSDNIINGLTIDIATLPNQLPTIGAPPTITIKSANQIINEKITASDSDSDGYIKDWSVAKSAKIGNSVTASLTGNTVGERQLVIKGDDDSKQERVGIYTITVTDNRDEKATKNIEVISQYCGDSEKNGADECDDGNTIDNDTCNNNCQAIICGDYKKMGNEVCEKDNKQDCKKDGYSGTQTCNNDCLGWGECTPTQSCGDGAINDNEQCDYKLADAIVMHTALDTHCSGLISNAITNNNDIIKTIYNATCPEPRCTFNCALASFTLSYTTGAVYVNPGSVTDKTKLYHPTPLTLTLTLKPTVLPALAIDKYEITNKPDFVNVNSTTGELTITPTDNNNIGSKTVVVTATKQVGASNITATANVSFTVQKNEWCGDGVTQSGKNEECDDGDQNNNNTCTNACLWRRDAFNIPLGKSADFAITGNSNSTNATTPLILNVNVVKSDSIIFTDNQSTGAPTVLTDLFQPIDLDKNSQEVAIKVGRALQTPYVWVVHSFLYDDTNKKYNPYSSVARIKTDKPSDVEVFNLQNGDGTLKVMNPSRTAVNVENGEAWIVGRDANFALVNQNGTMKKVCALSAGGRGVVIDREGNGWIGDNSGNLSQYNRYNRTPGDCTPIKKYSVGSANTLSVIYGLAIDSQNNIWISNRADRKIQRFNMETGTFDISIALQAISWLAADNPEKIKTSCDPYGIAIDSEDNIWVADTCKGVWRVDSGDPSKAVHQDLGSYGRTRGVAVDINGNIWVSVDFDNAVYKIEKNSSGSKDFGTPQNPKKYNIFAISGNLSYPIGLAGDTNNRMWVINYTVDSTKNITTHKSGYATVFDIINNTLVYKDVSINSDNTKVVKPYTYSDMSGLNRALLLRSGIWIRRLDSGLANYHWGKISWEQALVEDATGDNVVLSARAGDEANALNGAEWGGSLANNGPTNLTGRYLDIKIFIRSQTRDKTPAVWNLQILN